jgi:phosphoglycerate kinase
VKKIQDIKDLKGKKVLLRVDYNVPIKDGKVGNTERIDATLDTINFLTKKGASVVLCAHLGRPDGEVKHSLSLEPVARVLEKLNKKSVQFVPDTIGLDRKKAVGLLKPGDIMLLENLRFHKEEENNDPAFSKALAESLDLYVNDAFSNSHRAHASMVGVAKFLPAYAGLTLQKEVENLSKLLINPKRPFVVISGGVKISDKIGFLENLIKISDILLIGGGMANTFLCAEGLNIGKSVSEEDFVTTARDIEDKAMNAGVPVVLPEDVVTTKRIQEHPHFEEKDVEDVEDDDIITDIGASTVKNFLELINTAGTIFWNGPLGITEYPEFARGTIDIAKGITASKAFKVAGGGETVASIPDEIQKGFDFVSLSGGATMEYLEGKNLPALEVLK